MIDPHLEQGTLLAVSVPYHKASVHYRGYGERLGSESVLGWAIRRLRAMVPCGIPMVCVCGSDSECGRLASACAQSEPIEIVYIPAPDEARVCRALMDRYCATRVMFAALSHAVGPEQSASALLRFHRLLDAELTEAIGTAYEEPMYIVESSLVDDLVAAPFPKMPVRIIAAAAVIKSAVSHKSPLARDFSWNRIAVGSHLGVAQARWPEKIAISSARDIAVLRQAVADSRGTDGASLIDEWKRAATTLRDQRLAAGTAVRLGRRRRGRRIRVLYASDGSGFTGAQQSLCHLIGAIDRERYVPIAVVSNSGTFTEDLRRRGVSVICPEESIGAGDLENVLFAKRLLAEQAPEIIHANHGIGMPMTALALAANIPLVQHVRVQEPKRLLPQLGAATVVIAVSNYVRQCVGALDIDLRKVEVVWNGVNVDQFTPNSTAKEEARLQFGIPNDEFIVTMVARMARNKRHDVVISAMKHLRHSCGRGHLVLVGAYDGDREYHHAIRTQIERDGLTDHYTAIEFTPDIRQILYASDVVTIPSEDEPLSRAALEAMAVGLPVIVGDSGGTKEVIDHGETGLVVRCGDVMSLATALCELARNPGAAALMGGAAAAKVRSTLTSAHCAGRTMEIYERVLSGEYTRRVKSDRVTDSTSAWHVYA